MPAEIKTILRGVKQVEAKNFFHEENRDLLQEISHLKMKKKELYTESGPSSPDYLDLSIQLNLLITQYIDEKIANLNK